MYRVLNVVVLLAAMLVWAVPSAHSIGSRSDRVYKVGPGDRIKVTVYGERDLSGEFEVGDVGSIAFPLVGDIPATGATIQELEQAITDKLSQGFLVSPRVNVEVVNYRPFFILGEVRRPGSYPYASGMKVITAVALGGGFTYRAREESITIKRADDPDGKEVPVGHEDLVLPGDVIRVPERFF
jgi:polysaccharide export outer membrane protein